jgi:isochorismate synthase
MIPFSCGDTQRIVLIRPDRIYSKAVADVTSENAKLFDEMSVLPKRDKAEYADAFEKFHDALKDGRFEKLVLSRYSVRGYDGNVVEAFKRACDAYPRMMVYLCSAPGCGTWIGCTPEILLSGSKTHYRTVALAGTVPLSQTETGYQWSDKNKREQRIVADYVRHTLVPFASVIEEEGPYSSRAGKLLHLKTHFHFSPNQGVEIIDIVNALHPTPAVCGMPKGESFQFIEENEGYCRGFYSGVVGMLVPNDKTDLYVNLRCANIMGNHAVLYAGGGILSSSDVESEWQETEAKMKTVGEIL